MSSLSDQSISSLSSSNQQQQKQRRHNNNNNNNSNNNNKQQKQQQQRSSKSLLSSENIVISVNNNNNNDKDDNNEGWNTVGGGNGSGGRGNTNVNNNNNNNNNNNSNSFRGGNNNNEQQNQKHQKQKQKIMMNDTTTNSSGSGSGTTSGSNSSGSGSNSNNGNNNNNNKRRPQPHGRSKSFTGEPNYNNNNNNNNSSSSNTKRGGRKPHGRSKSFTGERERPYVRNDNNKNNNNQQQSSNNKSPKVQRRIRSNSSSSSFKRSNSNKSIDSTISGGGGGNSINSNTYKEGTLRRASYKTLAEIDLLYKENYRISADTLLSIRMDYLNPPTNNTNTNNLWNPIDRCIWTGTDRIQKIQDFQNTFYKPIHYHTHINNNNNDNNTNNIQAILNKLSWTNIDKLTIQFIEALKKDNNSITPDAVHIAMTAICNCAMYEPHFAQLYANLAIKLCTIHKSFKRSILLICQEQFEKKQSSNNNTNNNTNKKQNYIGLMYFIGELYMKNIIKQSIMISCCKQLLDNANINDEKLECFCKLMTVIGKKLQNDCNTSTTNNTTTTTTTSQEYNYIWDQVYKYSDRNNNNNISISTRVKFLLLSLIEHKDTNWEIVRGDTKEKPTTIAEIHKQHEQELKHGPITKTTTASLLQRSQSNKFHRSNSDDSTSSGGGPCGGRSAVRRAKSEMPTLATTVTKSFSGGSGSSGMKSTTTTSTSSANNNNNNTAVIQEINLTSEQVSDRMNSILKEFFINNDYKDALLSIQELVTNDDNSKNIIIRSGLLYVMERLEYETKQFIKLIDLCIEKKYITYIHLQGGLLSDPLEYLRDVEIDAPLAPKLLAIIISDWIYHKYIPFNCLLHGPEYFLSNDGKPAEFAALVLVQLYQQQQQQQHNDGMMIVQSDDIDTIKKLLKVDDDDDDDDKVVRSFLQQYKLKMP